MQAFPFRKIIATAIFIAVLGAGVYLFFLWRALQSPPLTLRESQNINTSRVLGSSVEGREVSAYTYGSGSTHVLFVGGVHGGYEWNSVLLAHQFIDYLEEHPEIIPSNVSVSIIPDANPDGVYKILGTTGRFALADVPSGIDFAPGRFNANKVDLNRNFDCNWKPESTWRGATVKAGTRAFSEPEARAIRDFVMVSQPSAVIFWHSSAGAVYASKCNGGILPRTLEVMNSYAKASGYRAVDTFDQYEITGDAEGWLASINIPAITVELQTHESVEWERNLAGILAVLGYFGVEDVTR